MIAPRSILALLVYGVEAVVGVALGGRIWVAIGPGARAVLRPLGVLGPFPMLGISFFAVVSIIAVFAAPFLPKTAPPPTAGRNRRILQPTAETRYGVSYEEAVETCRRTGEIVPRREDLPLLDPAFQGGPLVWLAKTEDEKLPIAVRRDCKGADCRLLVVGMTARPGRSPHAHVLCFRP